MRELVLDSNVLLLLFVGLHDRSRISTFKNTEKFTPADFDLLVEILASVNAIIVTPHILAEVSNLAGQLGEPARSKLFALIADRLQPFIEEHIPAVAAAASPAFRRLGLTDAAIAILVSQQRPCAVLTTDLDLWIFLTQAGVEATNFNHLRAANLGAR